MDIIIIITYFKMNQLEQIRLEKHKDFRRKTWLPQFIEKYRPLFDSEVKAQRILSKSIRKRFLPDVANYEHLDLIPGIYRMRVLLNGNNIKSDNDNIEESNDSIKESESSSEDYTVTKKNKSKNKSKQKSNKKNKSKNKDKHKIKSKSEETNLEKAIQDSLKEYDDQVKNIMNESMKDISYDLPDEDYEEYILNQAILESLNKESYKDSPKESYKDSQNNFELDEIWIVIDIRNFYKKPEQPLLINGQIYYLTEVQINKLLMLYKKVDPNSVSGMKYQQDLEYHKSIVHDKKI